LLENALKYSPPDSPVLVRVTFETDGVGWGVLTVQDQGVGIPAEELDNIFQRFKRGTNVLGRVSGTGIGLASVQHIVQSHHGSVEAASELGRGTAMTIRLPLQAPDGQP
jgi:signal transduction histidine kinase